MSTRPYAVMVAAKTRIRPTARNAALSRQPMIVAVLDRSTCSRTSIQGRKAFIKPSPPVP